MMTALSQDIVIGFTSVQKAILHIGCLQIRILIMMRDGDRL